MQRQQGFTLMELMVVVAIIAIIAAVAYPSYLKSAYKGRRADGKQALVQASQALERCYSTYGTYNNTSCPEVTALGGTVTSVKGYYSITATITGTTYTVAATAVAGGPQANDSGCTILTVNNLNQQGSGSTTATTDTGGCW